MGRNVLVLGSGPVAREVPGWANKKGIATAAVVDKPEVPPGHSQEAFAESTAHISPFKDVQNIDVVILVAAEATVENDRRIYEQLGEWNSKLIVIADGRLGFAPTEIVVSGSGTYSLEAVWQLFEEIEEPGEVDRPAIALRYWRSVLFKIILDKSINRSRSSSDRTEISVACCTQTRVISGSSEILLIRLI